jgi:pyruvate dehydrogenase E2 component (dihydrolipoamide acetyltransferase)
MSTPLRMPDLGTVEGDVVLVRWLKAEGDTVSLGEPLFEVETDKGVSEVEAAVAGVIEKLVLAAGTRAAAGTVIAHIRQPGETAGFTAGAAAGAAPTVPVPATAARVSAPAAPAAAPKAGVVPVKIAPSIRALAEKWGVDVSAASATGPGGMLTREDVLRERDSAPKAGASAAGSLSRHQASVARAVTQSHREKPTFRVNAQVEMTRAVAFRERGKLSGAAVSYDALFVKAAAMAISEQPLFRSWLRGDNLVTHQDTAVAFAVSVGDELYAPAVRGADRKSVAEISRDIGALAEKAKSHSLASMDAADSCFLVSNLGMFPVFSFDAIIYPEHCAALAVGSITQTPVAGAEGVRVAPVAVLTLTVDHRLINGRHAAQFTARVKEILETGAFA